MMKKAALYIAALLLLLAPAAAAQMYAPVDTGTLRVCPGPGAAGGIPDFGSAECSNTHDTGLSLHRGYIWLEAHIEVSPALADSDMPLGLYVSAKASSTLWLNGSLVGSNGKPSRLRDAEIPGQMDTVFPLPQGLVRAGDNVVVLEMSAHHSIIPLMAPVHLIAIAPFRSPTDGVLRKYLPSFLPLGILLLGALYFGGAALKDGHGGQRVIVPLMALFAAGQLVSEVWRGLVAYDYPFHDIRLLLILAFATATGACLFLHTLLRFVDRHRLLLGAAALVAYAFLVLPAPGFDNKSSMALLVPALLAALIAALAAVRRVSGAAAYALALFLFSGLIFLAPTRFLDVYFYYCIAALLVFLFAQELRAHIAERKLRADEQARADRLQLILDEKREQDSPSTLSLTSAGKVEIVKADDIVYVKGAGDYVELMLQDSSTKLHSATLAELETSLPGTFLRVHRSYLVNAAFVASLERDSSGSGLLVLTTGATVPVSRRIMPSVRKALA